MEKTMAFAAAGLAVLGAACSSSDTLVRHMDADGMQDRSAAHRWVEVMLEAAARDVERVGAEPTVLSRQMAIPMMAMFEAWAAYDAVALGPYLSGEYRRPAREHTLANKEEAIAHAMFVTCVDQYPYHAEYLRDAMVAFGFDPASTSEDVTTAAGIGRATALAVLEARHHDGANQLGDHAASNGRPYSDTTGYQPVNTADRVVDPDRWQPIPFDDGQGGTLVLPFLTPHWYLVEPFGLESSDQFRPGPPPKVGSAQLVAEVDECIELNAALDPDQKALVEFMRDGPRSTAQSGHWMRFAQDVSVRDSSALDDDVKLFFAVGVTAMDAFIASWESKRFYDSSRPWTLVRHYYTGTKIRGWGGPGEGTIELDGSEWQPYSPATFVTPPFPGYVSGHSCVSAACARILELHTGSNTFGVVEERHAGELTENGAACNEMQRVLGELPSVDGRGALTCDVAIPMRSFRETADLAGQSRVLGGYHIQADNVAGLQLGRDVAEELFPKIQSCFRGEGWPVSRRRSSR